MIPVKDSAQTLESSAKFSSETHQKFVFLDVFVAYTSSNVIFLVASQISLFSHLYRLLALID